MTFFSRTPGPPIVNGWTQFTDTDGTVVCVSTGGNDTTGTGSDSAPYKTLAKGATILNGLTSNVPHRLLLKCGDAWTDEAIGQIHVNGRSATEPLLISTYGSGPRPLVKTPASTSGILFQGGAGWGGDYTSVVGIEFYAYTRDPASFTGVGTSCSGVINLNPASWFLVEDCKISFYTDNLLAEFAAKDVVQLRRNIIVDSYNGQGVYNDHTSFLLMEENFLDHNGYNTDALTQPTGAASMFDHNCYIKSFGPARLARNIFARASSNGIQQRVGGFCRDNLFIDNPIAAGFGDGDSAWLFWHNLYCDNNVILGGWNGSGMDRAWGMTLYNMISDGCRVGNNIIANKANASGSDAGIRFEGSCSGVTISPNIIYN